MSLIKKIELDMNVYQAAKQRILYVYDSFDVPLVGFSGGKDSLAVVLMTIEVCAPLGIKPYVYFVDEEFAVPQTLDFIKWFFYDSEYANLIIPIWGCWQMESEVFCAGHSVTTIQWGKDRPEWLRPIQKDAFVDWERVYDIYSIECILARIFPGRSIAAMLGVRAGESYNRLEATIRSGTKTTRPCFVRKTTLESVRKITPIYDWTTNDVLYYLSTKQIINPLYYQLLVTGQESTKNLRTDTPLHGRQCNVAVYKKINPEYYDKLCQLFPSIHAAGIYNEQMKSSTELATEAAKKYGKSWQGILDYVNNEYTDDAQKKRAYRIINTAIKRHVQLASRGKGYSLLSVFQKIVGKKLDHLEIALKSWTRTEINWQNE